MTEPPRVAVVVGAWGRRDFLRSAVRSVAAQADPPGSVEIVVTKNFDDPAIDRELAELGATVLRDDEPVIGRWLRRAVRATRAPWVMFLDDDDEFAPERLARFDAVRRAHPDVGFYRCRVEVIDRAGAPVPAARWRQHEVDAGFDRIGARYFPPDGKAELFDVAAHRTFATFNSSSMAIRRDLLDGPLGATFERTRIPDTFLFLVGALAPAGVFLDDRRLTRFRFYGTSTTSEARWYDWAVRSEEEMADVASAHGAADWAAWFRGLAVHHGKMLRGATLMERIGAGAVRREVAGRTAEYLRYLAAHPGERAWNVETWAAGAYGAAYLLVPTAARAVARARLTGGPD
ncbi:MAG TPA: glycosyltransferase family A protein [Thermoplasmata archaeon]|nr:glycosyltransferase family A protein [Thermoplasmata archaeon]